MTSSSHAYPTHAKDNEDMIDWMSQNVGTMQEYNQSDLHLFQFETSSL